MSSSPSPQQLQSSYQHRQSSSNFQHKEPLENHVIIKNRAALIVKAEPNDLNEYDIDKSDDAKFNYFSGTIQYRN